MFDKLFDSVSTRRSTCQDGDIAHACFVSFRLFLRVLCKFAERSEHVPQGGYFVTNL